MSTIERIAFTRYSPVLNAELTSIFWARSTTGRRTKLLQIFWKDSSPWREANAWALIQVARGRDPATSARNITHLNGYANWLEKNKLTWTHFPDRDDERCLTMFRGELIRRRAAEEMAPSTASAQMAAVIRFYRWVMQHDLFEPGRKLWNDRAILVQLDNAYGMRRSLLVTSSELSIPNKRAKVLAPESGVLPVSVPTSRRIVTFASEHGPVELSILLRVSFSTGMRIGTTLSLRTATIERAAPHPAFPGWFTIAVGPSLHTPVKTKFSKRGEILVPGRAIEMLKAYIRSPRRLKRVALASAENRNLVFLTRFGVSYGNGTDDSLAMNTHICRLRAKARSLGESCLDDFNFHRARATFGTELAKIALKHGDVTFAIWMVKTALMHENEQDTLRYIEFVQSIDVLEKVSDDFSREFFGFGE